VTEEEEIKRGEKIIVMIVMAKEVMDMEVKKEKDRVVGGDYCCLKLQENTCGAHVALDLLYKTIIKINAKNSCGIQVMIQ